MPESAMNKLIRAARAEKLRRRPGFAAGDHHHEQEAEPPYVGIDAGEGIEQAPHLLPESPDAWLRAAVRRKRAGRFWGE